MRTDLAPFHAAGLTPAALAQAIDQHDRQRPNLLRLWDYYRNPMRPRRARRHAGPLDHDAADPGLAHHTPYTLAQEAGLPARLRLPAADPAEPGGRADPEVVIENDIAWRIDAIVDFIFGKPPALRALSPDRAAADAAEAALAAVVERSGGPQLWQDLGLIGAVYGRAHILLRAGPDGSVTFEAVDPIRAFAIADPWDDRAASAFIIRRRTGAPQ
ncbi:MAG: hypothetical protein IBJ11_09865, partial [Phycisphaerales bacterium]|nr:hypothetical protein [Phycisphaerales bacterium]